jgi:hypothetical protein
MKKCCLCKQKKEVSEFNKKSSSKDGIQNKCRECSKSSGKKHYKDNHDYYIKKNKKNRQRIKGWIFDYKKNSKCKCCGEKEPVCLDFHHTDSNNKDFEIAIAVRSLLSIEKIEEEIKKCVVVCSNCHRKIHAGLIAL